MYHIYTSRMVIYLRFLHVHLTKGPRGKRRLKFLRRGHIATHDSQPPELSVHLQVGLELKHF